MTRAGSAAALTVCVSVAALVFMRLIGRSDGTFDALWVRGLLKVGLWVVPAAGLAWWLAGRRWAEAWRALGLTPLAWRGVAIGLACTAPFALPWAAGGYRLAGPDELAGDVLLGPIAEEILFRGVLFLGLRRLGWSFWSAGALSALAFGVAHVPTLDLLFRRVRDALASGVINGEPGALGQFLTTWAPMLADAGAVTLQVAAGGLLFAWVCDRWQSLWPAIGLHAAINFWWIMTFGAEGTIDASRWAVTPWAVASALCVSAAILLTFRATRQPAPARTGRPRSTSLALTDS